MIVDASKELVRRFIRDVFEEGRTESVDEFVADAMTLLPLDPAPGHGVLADPGALRTGELHRAPVPRAGVEPCRERTRQRQIGLPSLTPSAYAAQAWSAHGGGLMAHRAYGPLAGLGLVSLLAVAGVAPSAAQGTSTLAASSVPAGEVITLGADTEIFRDDFGAVGYWGVSGNDAGRIEYADGALQ